jgi:tRNA (cytidine32/uridine32-2'-O)-methyltransferase
MVTTGLSDLRLVNPVANPLDEMAFTMAHGSHELLQKAKTFPTLAEAVADCSLVVATSHEIIRNRQKAMRSREMGMKLAPYCRENKVAILFGRESCGLHNSEINLCTWVVNIPAASSYPSLNLAQAVMVISYELFMASTISTFQFSPLADNATMERFFQYVQEILDLAGFHHRNNRPSIFLGVLRRIFTRTGLEEREVKALYKLFSQLKNSIQKT